MVEGYSWVPPGLTSNRVEEYMRVKLNEVDQQKAMDAIKNSKEIKYIIDDQVKDFQKFYLGQVNENARQFAKVYLSGHKVNYPNIAIAEAVKQFNNEIFHKNFDVIRQKMHAALLETQAIIQNESFFAEKK